MINLKYFKFGLILIYQNHLKKDASYDDYSSHDFKVIELENKTKKKLSREMDHLWKWIARISLLMNIILKMETIL